MPTYIAHMKGIWRLKLTGPEALLDAIGAAEVEVTGFNGDDQDVRNLEFEADEMLAKRMGFDSYDDLPEQYTPMTWTAPELGHNEFVTPEGNQQWFVGVYSVGQGYGGPEEGGWWFECGELVQQTAVNSFEEAQELRNRLAAGEFPDTGKRYSVLAGDDYRINIDIRPMVTSFPDTRPHYE